MCAVTGIQQNIKDQEREREREREIERERERAMDGARGEGGKERARPRNTQNNHKASVSIHACTCLYIDLFPQVLLETRSRGIALSGTLA